MPIMSGAQSSPSALVLITDELITMALTSFFTPMLVFLHILNLKILSYLLLMSVLNQAFGEKLTLKYCCVHKG